MRPSHFTILLLVLITAIVIMPPQLVDDPDGELMMVTWGMPFEDLLFRDVYARGFEQLHPGLSIDYQRYPEVHPKYEAWHSVGRGADVMRLPITFYPNYVERGIIANLDEFMNDPNIGLTPAQQADFFPHVWEPLEIDGGHYGLPSDNAQYGLYYNKDLFDAYNAAHPDDPLSYPSAEWTWNDLRAASQKLTIVDDNGRVRQYGVSFDVWNWPFLAFFAQAGGQVWNEDFTETYINSPAGVAAAELIGDLIPRKTTVRAYNMADTASGPDDLFKVGRLAILLDGSWRAPNIELDRPNLNFAIAPLPRGEKRAVVSGSVLWCVSAHSRNKRMAWQMVKWLVAYEQSLAYWNKLRVAPPALMSVVRSPAFEQTTGIVVTTDGRRDVRVPPMPREKYDDRAAWLEYAITPDPETGEMPGFMVVSPFQVDLENNLNEALIAIVNDDQDPQAMLDRAAAKTHANIDRVRASQGLPPVNRD